MSAQVEQGVLSALGEQYHAKQFVYSVQELSDTSDTGANIRPPYLSRKSARSLVCVTVGREGTP
jgi:hypothetical protein